MEVLTVVWSTGSCDDHGNAHSYAGVHGIYNSEESAKRGLEECRDEILADIKNALNPEGDCHEYEEEANIQVYGSVDDSYFEIDYKLGIEPVEVYIGITPAYTKD